MLGGQDAVTVETIFASTSNSGWPTLFSYAAGHVDGNDFRIQFHPMQNELSFFVNGSGVFVGVPNFNDLFDGQPHSIAVSWSTTGDWALYVDGQSIQSGSFLEAGNSIDPGGTLLFGQEQDSNGGSLQPAETFSGTLFDVRIWDHVRTDSEVAATYQQKLDPNATHNGLIANWQFDQFDGSTVTDVVSGNNLSVQNVVGPGFFQNTPVNDLTVAENSSNATSVGFVIATGGDPAATSFTLTDNAGGRFAIDSATGEITVADGSLLNFEDNASHDVTVEVTDGTTTYSELVTIDVSDINEAPAFSNLNNTVTYGLGGNPVTLDADVSIFDPELSAADDFDGSILTIREFSGHTLGINGVQVAQGQPIIVSGTQIGVVEGNSGGQREFHFTTGATNALVNEFLQSITYEFTGSNPPGSINLDWTFDDGTGQLANGQTSIQLIEPIDLSSGVELNADGGNDALLISDSGLGTDLDATTFEIQFAANDIPDETVFLSFSNGVGTNDEFSIQIQNDGRLQLDFGSASGLFASGINYSDALLDGEFHSLAVTWNRVGGAWAIYIDGQLEESDSNLNQGQALDTTSGRFVFGQEQDGLNTGYQADQHFSGTIYDVRIWDRVRSGTEIADNYQQKLDPNDLPNGLVANWQFDGFDNSGQVVDVVGGNNLSVGNATGTGFVSSTPVDSLNVDENSVEGTRVGFVIPTNVDTSTSIYSLSNDVGGRFAIDSATGEITVANQALLNHEANQSHIVTVAVTDATGNDYGEDFTITVNNVNEAPTFDAALTPTFTLESLSLIHI